MAGNKFATMLHRKTNKITLVLTYALLEWILISLLLLNALFSYLITKFANYFGLKPPCLLCSRIDHILDSKKKGGRSSSRYIVTSSYNELICQQHAIEISKLGYCSSHRKLVESRRRLCEDCLFSVACDSVGGNSRLDGSLMEVLRWLKVVGRTDDDGNGHEVDVRCCCCDEEVITKPAVLQLASGLDDQVGGFEKQNLNSIEEEEEEEEEEDEEEEEEEEAEEGTRDDEQSDHTRVVSAEPDKEFNDHEAYDHGIVTSREPSSDTFVRDTDPRSHEESSEGFLRSEFGYEILDADADDDEDIVMEAEKEPLLKKDSSLPPPPPVDDRDPSSDETILPQHLEFYIDNYDYRLVPVGTMDFAVNAESKGEYPAGQVDEKMSRYQAQEGKDNKILGLDGGMKAELGSKPAADFVLESCELGLSNNKSSIVSKESEDDVSNKKNKELEEKEAQEQFHRNNDQITMPAPPASVTPLNEMTAGTDELQSFIPSASDVTYQKSVSQTDQAEFVDEDSADITSDAEAIKEAATAAELTDQTQPPEVENTSYDEVIVPNAVNDLQGVTEAAATVNELSSEDYARQSKVVRYESEDRLDEALLTDVIYTVIANAVDETHVEVVTELAAHIPSAPEDASRTDGHGNDEDLDDEIDVEEPSTSCKDESPGTFVDDEEVSPLPAAEDDTNDPNAGQVNEEQTEQCGNITTKAREQGGGDEEGDPIDRLLEEEKVPDTPTSVEESIDNLHTRTLLGGHTDSVNEESVDGGSIISEPEGVLGTNDATAVEYLKSALRAERKALKSLYTELEEERNAAAVAASQTLAMINRLQEERAAIEMEASQYHRMMEEQSEYDQEALQMMNELVTKREKEKEELEKEVEVYRRKVMEYEERERMRILRSRRRDGSCCSRSRTSSAHSLSNGEESTEELLSADLSNIEVKEEDLGSSSCRKQQQQQRQVVGENGDHHDDTAAATPVDAVLNLEESLAVFEDERMSILEQLKALEEKLVTLAGEEEQHIESMQPFDIFCEENANQFDKSLEAHELDKSFEYSTNGHETNGHTNGTAHHHDDQASSMSSRVNGSHPKQLLPLFDATELDYSEEYGNNGNHRHYGEDDGCFHSMEKGMGSHLTKFELEKKRLVLEAEVDHVYDRLQALEADREFVKHCVGSLRKGDKGINLLQEILQHLRDLKNVEMKSRMNGDDHLVM